MGKISLSSWLGLTAFSWQTFLRYRKLVYLFFLLAQPPSLLAFSSKQIILVKNGKAQVTIQETSKPTVVQQFATAELSKYLHQISGAGFSIKAYSSKGEGAIRIELDHGKEKEAYSISIRENNIILSGNSDRAILYAVYDFLNRLGCIWVAPGFDLYEGHSEIIPHHADLTYSSNSPILQQPAFSYRKIDVDGGRSHNAENLKKMVDWMAKVRYNTLRVPVNLNGNGRIQWDRWREELIPELEKRGMMLEVGGHGYQNFLNAKMEDGTLFKKHPDWFAKDSSCNPTPSERLVFNTSNTDAVNYFIKNVIDYIQEHPEINIFGLWPPDVGGWADCKEFESLGTPADRQAAFTNKVAEAIHKVRSDIVVEIIAYSFTLLPPSKIALNKKVHVDFCPINQSFEKQIYDGSSQNNSDYVSALKKWKQSFPGIIGLYSYFRKYAWRSAPNVMPHYIQKDMQWYAGNGLQGISTYAEPGDWFTYELNHFILAAVSWNPTADVNVLCDQFYKARYEDEWMIAKMAYVSLEEISPVFGSIPFTSLKQKAEIGAAKLRVEKQIIAVSNAIGKGKQDFVIKNFSRLLLMLQYLQKDLEIQEGCAQGTDKEIILQQIKNLLVFLEANVDKGVFILTGQNDLARFTKKYGLTNQSLLD